MANIKNLLGNKIEKKSKNNKCTNWEFLPQKMECRW
jgi:hypothetical protein